jgi:N-acetylglucosaminyldiphosphoundecaprenol N-acetyl-beta-D-mannosaminyltransferase
MAVIDRSANRPIKHFYCGGKAEVAAKLRDVCADRYGNRNCVGVFSPPFREMSDQELQALAGEINGSDADIVWVGLSTPKQEVFATRLARFTRVHVLATIGAAFDFHVGNVKEAPGSSSDSGSSGSTGYASSRGACIAGTPRWCRCLFSIL